MQRVLWRVAVYKRFWWGNLREREDLEDPGRWEDDIKMDIQEVELWGYRLDRAGLG